LRSGWPVGGDHQTHEHELDFVHRTTVESSK
jgi:hypothetical protein